MATKEEKGITVRNRVITALFGVVGAIAIFTFNLSIEVGTAKAVDEKVPIAIEKNLKYLFKDIAIMIAEVNNKSRKSDSLLTLKILNINVGGTKYDAAQDVIIESNSKCIQKAQKEIKEIKSSGFSYNPG